MRTHEDALRSVKRYLALVLGDTWEVRMWADEGSYAAPLAKVAESGPALFTSHRVYTDVVQPVQVHFFLPVAATVSEAMFAARKLRQQITEAIEIGIDQGRPRRIPLYDYDGLSESESSSARNYYDYLKVRDLSVNTVPDSNVPTGVVVVADMRIAWSQYTTVTPDSVTVESVRVTTSAG